MREGLAALLLVLFVGCEKPPEAPEGLDDSTRYLLREFYGDDATVAAGLSGLLAWYDSDGASILDQGATLETSADFSLAPLVSGDIGHLALVGERNPASADGIIAVSSLACGWAEAEALLVRADQAAVFDGKWSHYERVYASARAPYEAARAGDSYPALGAQDPTADPFPAVGEDAGLLLTENAVGTDEVGVVLDYSLHLRFRHGRYTVDRGGATEEILATVILSWQPERAEGEGGANSLEQVYSVEVLVAEGAASLRFVATWNEVRSELLGEDSANILATTTVNRMRAFAGRMSEICDGTVTIAEEIL